MNYHTRAHTIKRTLSTAFFSSVDHKIDRVCAHTSNAESSAFSFLPFVGHRRAAFMRPNRTFEDTLSAMCRYRWQLSIHYRSVSAASCQLTSANDRRRTNRQRAPFTPDRRGEGSGKSMQSSQVKEGSPCRQTEQISQHIPVI